MKFLFVLIFSLSLGSFAIGDEYQRGYSRVRTCTRNEYKEEYVPGNRLSPGYVKSWTEIVEVPCESIRTKTTTRTTTKTTTLGPEYADIPPLPNAKVDQNDCKEGTIIGGLLGAGLTMSGTRGKDRWWAVPAGGAAGAMIGCQLDGG